MISRRQQFLKRLFDLICSIISISMALIPLFVLVLISSVDTQSFGVFFQVRVGRKAKLFTLYKIKTMRELSNGEAQVTKFGKFLRVNKLDELPQLFNVLFGSMSIVGPRPDVQGYADLLEGENRIILSVKPGITGPSTLRFANEEETLVNQKDPLIYNDVVIWPEKVEINRKYVENWSLISDFEYIYETILYVLKR